MPVYGSRATLDHLHREYYYIFERPDYPGIPKLLLHEIGEAPFEAAGIALQPVPVWHSKMPVLGFRAGNFAYITDASHIPEASMQLLVGVKILIINALRIEPHYSHFNLEQALAVAEAIGPDQAWFTHISHLMGRHADVSARLPGWAQLAWDGLELHWEA
jgi:phosphoribosyl 1,2-cyclic phosphate phosphodiesterase